MGGQLRNNIAAIDASTGAVTAWNPDADGQVWTMAVAGETVYAGGSFWHIGGQARSRVAALDATSGAVLAWSPNSLAWTPYNGGVDTSDFVNTLMVSGETVYAGGRFLHIGGQPKSGFAQFDIKNSVRDWRGYR
jgi:hypothetical protein